MAQKRLQSSERRLQIIDVTKNLIQENGLAWASVARISDALGITQAALYHHFKNRREILLATMDSVAADYLNVIVSETDDTFAFIREISEALYDATVSHPGHAQVLFEFICAPPSENLREELLVRLSLIIGYVEDALKRGVDQGIVRDDVDISLTAWEIFSLGLTLNFASILQVKNFVTKAKALEAVEHILQSIRK